VKAKFSEFVRSLQSISRTEDALGEVEAALSTLDALPLVKRIKRRRKLTALRALLKTGKVPPGIGRKTLSALGPLANSLVREGRFDVECLKAFSSTEVSHA
jgi:hypothetical protein